MVRDPHHLTKGCLNKAILNQKTVVSYTQICNLGRMGTILSRKSVRFWVRDTG